jgi:hypothetical protein
MTDAVRKWELIPNRREVIHDAMFHHLLMTSSSHHKDSLHAAATDWSLLGRYTDFRKSEWCQDSPHIYARITDPLWGDRPNSIALIAEDFVLKNAHGIRVVVSPSTTPADIQHAEMPIRYQKNQDNYQVLTYSASPSLLDTCPVRAILHILPRGICLGLPPLQPLAIHTNPLDPRGYSFVTGAEYTQWLKSVAAAMYRLPSKDPSLARWGTHSLWVTATNLLHWAQFSASFIKNRLRWRSDTFQMYLRNTFHVADAHSQALDLCIQPPNDTDRRPLEPHKIVLSAAAPS